MWESVALIIAAILAAYAVCMSFYNTYRSETLDDREKELKQQALDLDGRANRIAAQEQELCSAGRDIIRGSYTVTESDLMRYDSDDRILKAAKAQMARTLADQIVRNHDPEERVNGMGLKIFEYRIKLL